jgi:hypothetical protein
MIRRTFLKAGLAGFGALAVPETVRALNVSLTSSGKKWVVLYGSKCGSTKEYANYINEGMGSIADVVDIAKTTPNAGDYDYFVIGGWINGGVIQPSSIKTFVTNNKAALKDKIRGLFVVCGNNGNATPSAQTDAYLKNNLITTSGVSDKPGKVLFGRSDPACNGLGVTYDNVKKADGVAFGKQIIDAATAVLLDGSEKSTRFALSHTVDAFNAVATISYVLSQSAVVQVTVNALSGKRLATLVSSCQEAGHHSVRWNTRDLASGVYLYRIDASGFAESRILQVAGYKAM